jgi:CheY-like chemotaxis protein
VLVVDGYRDNADSLAILLRLWGYETRAAYEETIALREAMDFRPDAVLLDLGMPGHDGWRLVQRIRSEARLPDALMIAMTGYGRDEDLRRLWTAGCDLHFLKPLDLDFLRQVLAEGLQEEGMTPEELAAVVTSLTAAATVVEAIGSSEIQRQRGWDLRGWHSEAMDWGVRFRHHRRGDGVDGEVLAVSPAGIAPAAVPDKGPPTRKTLILLVLK